MNTITHTHALTHTKPVRFPGNLRFCPADNLKYLMDYPHGHPGEILDVSGTWPIFFVLEWGGQNTSQKNENRGISDFSQFHVCFCLAVIQNLSFLFKGNLQDYLDFSLVGCHRWNRASKWCMWKGCIQRSHSYVRSSLKVHLHSEPSDFLQDHWFGFQFSMSKFLLSSLVFFFPFWGSRYFVNSGTSNQRAITNT